MSWTRVAFPDETGEGSVPEQGMGLPGPQPAIEDAQPIDVFIENQRRQMESLIGGMKTENVGEDMLQAQRDQQAELEGILRQKQQEGFQFAGTDEHGEEAWVSKDSQNWQSVYRFE
jgi:hypothetical protein